MSKYRPSRRSRPGRVASGVSGMNEPASTYAEKRDALAARLKEGRGPVGLGKDTSNLFRDRGAAPQRKLDVREFREVLHVDPEAGFVEAEGMAPYEALVQASLAHGVMRPPGGGRAHTHTPRAARCACAP